MLFKMLNGAQNFVGATNVKMILFYNLFTFLEVEAFNNLKKKNKPFVQSITNSRHYSKPFKVTFRSNTTRK